MLEQQVVGDGPHAAAAVADVVQQLLLENVPLTLSKTSLFSAHLEVYEHARLGVGVALDLVECHQQPVAGLRGGGELGQQPPSLRLQRVVRLAELTNLKIFYEI